MAFLKVNEKILTIKRKAIFIGYSLIVKYLITCIIVGLLFLLKNIFNLEDEIYPNNSGSISNLLQKSGLWGMLFSFLIYAPVIEECIFRSWINLKSHSLSVWVSAFVFFGIEKALKVKPPFIILELSFVFLCYLLFRYLFKRVNYRFEPSIFLTYVTLIVSSILFGLLHARNYNEINLYLILFVLPHQLIGGFILGVVRLRVGLVGSIITHSIFNLTIILLFYISTIS